MLLIRSKAHEKQEKLQEALNDADIVLAKNPKSYRVCYFFIQFYVNFYQICRHYFKKLMFYLQLVTLNMLWCNIIEE